jgi:hypothetical protein
MGSLAESISRRKPQLVESDDEARPAATDNMENDTSGPSAGIIGDWSTS